MPLHKKIFYLLLLLLPTQLGLHLWPSWAYVFGRRIDYLSPTIYTTDILIFLIIIFSFKKFRRSIQKKTIFSLIIILIRAIARIKLCLLILLLIFFNILNSPLPYLTTYKWLKIFEFFFLGFYIIKNTNLSKEWPTITRILSLGIIFESLLAIFQFINQSSLNGVFYWFGERTFTAATPNIAKAILNGALAMRPYATFPHPNVFGGYLAVLLPLILKTDFKPIKLKLLTLILGTVALFLTFSRPAILVGIFTAAAFLIKKSKILTLISIILLTFFSLNLLSLEKESLARRFSLNQSAAAMFSKNPVFGVGLGNFIPRLPQYSPDKEVVRFLQPAHNIYLLIAAETGLIGLLTFLFVVFRSLKSTKLLLPLFSILILGLFDHYFFTLQQTQLLFVLILGLSVRIKE